MLYLPVYENLATIFPLFSLLFFLLPFIPFFFLSFLSFHFYEPTFYWAYVCAALGFDELPIVLFCLFSVKSPNVPVIISLVIAWIFTCFKVRPGFSDLLEILWMFCNYPFLLLFDFECSASNIEPYSYLDIILPLGYTKSPKWLIYSCCFTKYIWHKIKYSDDLSIPALTLEWYRK